jgi:galacturonokinase
MILLYQKILTVNGILEQSANILGVDEHLMFMDCRTGEYQLLNKPDNMEDFEIVVVFSGLSKTLISTDYNRVDECKVAAWIIQECNNFAMINYKLG